jgi:hypothetical protein
MSRLSTPQRLKIALGGFVSFIGVAVLSLAVLTLTDSADLPAVMQGNVALVAISVVAALDIGTGLLLILKNREIILSLTANQQKTSDQAD